ncbi:MAG: hypothetical protein L0Y75_02380 [Acidobacteria bacterium]|nr:hypothetical protein [Acidobacteriota bacterium]
MPRAHSDYENSVFINCPFDEQYVPLFEAAVFVIYDAGFRPRCALESSDGAEVRVDKVMRLIAECRLSIHDLSRVETDQSSLLPRFNMPLELGIDLGCRRFGRSHLRRKNLLILDAENYRYRKFISDISGQDIQAHSNDPLILIRVIRDWLSHQSGGRRIAGGAYFANRFRKFEATLPKLYAKLKWDANRFNYGDYTNLVQTWLQEHPS